MHKIGILGGTFDPPHIGHLILASEAQASLKLDRIEWLLTPFPPHKPNRVFAPLSDRIDMVSGMIADNDLFSLSYIDINRQPPHYAYETMLALHDSSPNVMYIYIMGSDSLKELPTWYRADKFLSLCYKIGVMHRLGAEADLLELETKIPGVSKKVIFFNSPMIDISSTLIRERIIRRLPVRYLLHAFVYQIILTRSLYAHSSPEDSAYT